MHYILTTEGGAKVLVSSRCQSSAKQMVEQRLDTRVVSIDYLDSVIHKEFDSLVYLLAVDSISGESP